MKFRTVEAEKANYPVAMTCRASGVSAGGFYAWSKRRISPREEGEMKLAVRVREIHGAHRGRYGAPRIHAQLLREGHRTSRKRVARIMRQRGLKGRRPRQYRSTTQSKHGRPVAENVLDRRFEVAAPNDVWVGDITYLPTEHGWLYLAVLIDLFTREVVGWATSASLDRGVCVDALKSALQRHHPPRGLLHHTDRGVQYTSGEYTALLAAHGITPSMSRKGNCWDNAVAESFFATLKIELGDEALGKTAAELNVVLFAYIEGYYYAHRLHSTLGYQNPFAYEACKLTEPTAAPAA